MTDEQLAAFLVQAKRATYAAREDEAVVPALLPASHQLEYRLGDFLYRDIYFGSAYFVGQETVYEGETALWAMGYAGGMTNPAEDMQAAYQFLRFALRQADTANPYRGPGLIRDSGYQYTSQTNGTLENFWGVERISRSRGILYELHYHGGRIK